MAEYRLEGLHCSDCSDDLEKRLNAFTSKSKVTIDYKHNTLTVDEADADMSRIKKVLEFEKIILTSTKEGKASVAEPRGKEAHTSHGHHHGHAHGIESIMNQETSRKMIFVFFLNLLFSAIEFIFGFLFNSIAIMTDAVHDLGDALSIGLASYFEKISTKEANERYSFGHQRFSLLGALVTSIVLLGGSTIVLLNAIPRLINPQPVNHEGMFWLAIVAIFANGFSAWLMSRGTSNNESLINLHMMEDVLGWAGVLAVSIILRFTDWYFLDPLLSLSIAGFIIYKTGPLFKDTIEIFLEATPKQLSRKQIEKTLLSIEGITNVSHLHVWSIDGNEHALTMTVSTTVGDMDELEEIKEKIRKDLSQYHIYHSTIEIVYDPMNTLTQINS